MTEPTNTPNNDGPPNKGNHESEQLSSPKPPTTLPEDTMHEHQPPSPPQPPRPNVLDSVLAVVVAILFFAVLLRHTDPEQAQAIGTILFIIVSFSLLIYGLTTGSPASVGQLIANLLNLRITTPLLGTVIVGLFFALLLPLGEMFNSPPPTLTPNMQATALVLTATENTISTRIAANATATATLFTKTPTNTSTYTLTPTLTPSSTFTPDLTAENATADAQIAMTVNAVQSLTAAAWTNTPTPSNTPSPTNTLTETPTATNTQTNTPTVTTTFTLTPTITRTPTLALTPTPTFNLGSVHIDITPVTQSDFDAFTDATSDGVFYILSGEWWTEASKDDDIWSQRPQMVDSVTGYEATAYCRWRHGNAQMRLPTPSEIRQASATDAGFVISPQGSDDRLAEWVQLNATELPVYDLILVNRPGQPLFTDADGLDPGGSPVQPTEQDRETVQFRCVYAP